MTFYNVGRFVLTVNPKGEKMTSNFFYTLAVICGIFTFSVMLSEPVHETLYSYLIMCGLIIAGGSLTILFARLARSRKKSPILL